MTALALKLDTVAFSRPGGLRLVADAELAAGERLALIGPSGSGKSTLLALIAGFERSQSGRILMPLDGKLTDMTGEAPEARPLSILFQDNNLFPHLDVAANVGLGIAPTLRFGAADRARIETALGRVGLADKAGRHPPQLSGGERQRAGLARALVRNHPLLLMDEPLASLGPGLRNEMIDLIRAVADERGLTIIMVTHDPDDAARFASRVALIDDGRLGPLMPPGVLDAPPKGSALSRYLGRD